MDPEKVSVEGVHAICSACLRVFSVHHPTENASEGWTNEPAETYPDVSDATSESASTPLGPVDEVVEGALSRGVGHLEAQDPHDRARRLARVVVSDIIAYYPTGYRESLSRGTLKEDFQDEVKKSWKEYIDQVSEELAESTPYFIEALNEILAEGEDVFP